MRAVGSAARIHPGFWGASFKGFTLSSRGAKAAAAEEKQECQTRTGVDARLGEGSHGELGAETPLTQWSFTLILEKQHLYLSCGDGNRRLWDWTTSILKAGGEKLACAKIPDHLRTGEKLTCAKIPDQDR
uniref:Uncharacterized protein n=1 Tax=Sphaerodactylus townsendi TaxID=933632 RepID=A0ACB8EBI6_9SAUR